LETWDDEGGALHVDSIHRELGRRIEHDGSWTVYNVFTGTPVTIDGKWLLGMSSADSLSIMMNTNSENAVRRRAARSMLLRQSSSFTWHGKLKKRFNKAPFWQSTN
jgi:hypothetical protein